MKTVFKGDGKKLIKGVNKQIIEIKCTNNEYFERALLFVNSRCNNFSEVPANEIASEYLDELTGDIAEGISNKKSDRFILKLLMVVLSVTVTAAIIMITAVIIK